MKEIARRAVRTVVEAQEPDADAVGTRRSVAIERISPDGHDLLDAALLLCADDEEAWREAPMRPIDNDRWSGRIELTRNRWHRYAIEAWRDAFGSWLPGLQRKE